VVFLSIIAKEYAVKAFAPSASSKRTTSSCSISLNKRNAYHVFSSSIQQLNALPNNDEDFPEDYYDDDYEDEDEEDGLDSLIGKKLGINIGAQLPTLSQEEIDDIRIAGKSAFVLLNFVCPCFSLLQLACTNRSCNHLFSSSQL